MNCSKVSTLDRQTTIYYKKADIEGVLRVDYRCVVE